MFILTMKEKSTNMKFWFLSLCSWPKIW